MKCIIFFFLFFSGLTSCSSSQIPKYSKIEYEVGPCFGFCPIYKIIINFDRNAVLEAEHYNFSEGENASDLDKSREGTFKATISKENYNKLIFLTDDADIKILKDKYEDKKIMDASRTNLRVYFFDGSKKEILMYAGDKPEKLTKLCDFISNLKYHQQWKKIK